MFDIKVIKSPQRNPIFFTVLGVFTYFNIAKKPYLNNLNSFQNVIILNERNF